MFAVDELITYGNAGVCRVTAIGCPDIKNIDKSRLYYTLAPIYHEGTVFAPVDINVSMRRIVTREEAQQCIRDIPAIAIREYLSVDAKTLALNYRKSIQTHDCTELLRLIKSVSYKHSLAKKNNKKPSQIDERFLKEAEDLLYGEFAVALDMPKSEVKTLVENALGTVELDG